MADSTIPQLQEAAAEDVTNDFILPVDSGTETYKLRFENLMAYLVANFPADWITEAMVKANAITSGKIADGAITTAKIGNSQVTGAKIASNTITNGNVASNAEIAGSKIQAAGSSNSGVMTSGTQTIGGNKTWSGTQTYNSSITQNTRSLSTGVYSSSNLDVSNVNIVYLIPSTGNIALHGFAGGTAGQVLYLAKTTSANLAALFHNSASSASGKIYTADSANHTLSNYGGAVLVFNGSLWFVVALFK